MEDYWYSSYFGQIQSGISRMDIEPRLSIVERIISVSSFESGITGFVSDFNASEERFKGEVYPNHSILEDLRVDGFKFWVFFFPRTKHPSCVEVGNRFLFLFPGVLSDFERFVVDNTTDFKGIQEFMFRT